MGNIGKDIGLTSVGSVIGAVEHGKKLNISQQGQPKGVVMEKEIEELKAHFEANMLNGDKVNDCGKAMLSAECVWEYIKKIYTNRTSSNGLRRLDYKTVLTWLIETYNPTVLNKLTPKKHFTFGPFVKDICATFGTSFPTREELAEISREVIANNPNHICPNYQIADAILKRMKDEK